MMTKTKQFSIIAIIFLLFFSLTSCKKEEKNYLKDPIAIVYKDNVPYIINENQELFSLEEYDSIVQYFDDIIIVKKDNKFAYLKNTGEPLSEAIYEEAYPFSEGKAVVKLNDIFYIIDNNMNVLYEFSQNYYSNSSFHANHLVVSNGKKQGYLVFNKEKSTFSFLNFPNSENEEDTKNYFVYDYCDDFKDEYAVVGFLNDEQNMKFTHINTKGERLYDLEWDFANNFYDGYAVVGLEGQYPARVYCGNIGLFDEYATPAYTSYMGYMYVSPDGNYIGGNDNPEVFSKANNFKNGIAMVTKLVFKVDNYKENHRYDYSTNRFFNNYLFIRTNGVSLFEKDLFLNNWGGVSSLYNGITQYNNYYITSYFSAVWTVKATAITDETYLEVFKDVKWDLDTYNNENKEDPNYPWISEYLKEFTLKNYTYVYAIDRVTAPYELTTFKTSKYLENLVVAKAQVYSGTTDTVGLISLKEIDDSLQISYIIPPLYNDIIF